MYAGDATRLDVTQTTGRGVPPARRPAGVCNVRPAWLLLGCLLGFPPGSQATDVATPMTISARVLPHARLEGPTGPSAITLTSADLARGYVDVARRYRLSTNAPGRVVLLLNPRLGLTEAIDVAGFGPTLRMHDEGLEIAADAAEIDLSFRLWLRPGLAAGEYPLPLQLAAVVQ